MLVLSRQRDESILIGDDIEVVLVDVRGDKVRLGVNAPKEISVHRKEVYDAIRRENRAATQIKPEDLSGIGPGAAVRNRAGLEYRSHSGTSIEVWHSPNCKHWYALVPALRQTVTAPAKDDALRLAAERIDGLKLAVVQA